MVPKDLRFDFRAHPNFFKQSRWWKSPYNDSLSRKLSFRIQHVASPSNSTSTSPKAENSSRQSVSGIRWAIVVPKKVGNAVQRAQIKRFLRHALIALFQQSPTLFQAPYNVVIFTRSSLSSQSEAENLISAFLQSLSKADSSEKKE